MQFYFKRGAFSHGWSDNAALHTTLTSGEGGRGGDRTTSLLAVEFFFAPHGIEIAKSIIDFGMEFSNLNIEV